MRRHIINLCAVADNILCKEMNIYVYITLIVLKNWYVSQIEDNRNRNIETSLLLISALRNYYKLIDLPDLA